MGSTEGSGAPSCPVLTIRWCRSPDSHPGSLTLGGNVNFPPTHTMAAGNAKIQSDGAGLDLVTALSQSLWLADPTSSAWLSPGSHDLPCSWDGQFPWLPGETGATAPNGKSRFQGGKQQAPAVVQGARAAPRPPPPHWDINRAGPCSPGPALTARHRLRAATLATWLPSPAPNPAGARKGGAGGAFPVRFPHISPPTSSPLSLIKAMTSAEYGILFKSRSHQGTS